MSFVGNRLIQGLVHSGLSAMLSMVAKAKGSVMDRIRKTCDHSPDVDLVAAW